MQRYLDNGANVKLFLVLLPRAITQSEILHNHCYPCSWHSLIPDTDYWLTNILIKHPNETVQATGFKF